MKEQSKLEVANPGLEAKASAIALDGDSVGAFAAPNEGNIGDDFITEGACAVER